MLVLCDIDGCIANPREYVRRYLSGPVKNWKGYYAHTLEMVAIPQITTLLNGLVWVGAQIVFHTGRNESNRRDMRQWLNSNLAFSVMDEQLVMRRNGDRSLPALLKLANCMRFRPDLVIEDEPETVELLRKHRYTVLQVHGYRMHGDDNRDNIPE